MLDPAKLRLTVVTTGTPDPERGHRTLAEAALSGGASALQLRAPELDDAALLALALELRPRCRDKGMLFIVNDRLEVALTSGADGVHLGQADDPVGARERLGPDRILGVSVTGAAQAQAAERMGATYVGVTVWPTATKPEARGHGPAGVREVRAAVKIPVVGIGGIDRHNMARVFDAGASGIAVISAVAGASDPFAAVVELRTLIDELREVSTHGPSHR